MVQMEALTKEQWKSIADDLHRQVLAKEEVIKEIRGRVELAEAIVVGLLETDMPEAHKSVLRVLIAHLVEPRT